MTVIYYFGVRLVLYSGVAGNCNGWASARPVGAGTNKNIMDRRLAHVSLLVEDYDEAIEFFTNKLDFDLVEDEKLSETKRWVLVKPRGQGNCSILLARASDDNQRKFVGNQSGGRVFLFLTTDDIDRDLVKLKKHNVKIVREPSDEVYGRVLVFEDLYGNKWDLIERSNL